MKKRKLIVHSTEMEDRRKRSLIKNFTYIGYIVLPIFGGIGIYNGNILYASVMLVFLVILAFNAFILRRYRTTIFSIHLTLSALLLNHLIVFLFFCTDRSSFLWLFIFPILAVILANNRLGTVYATSLLLIIMVTLYIDAPFININYTNEFLFRFTFVYLVITILINIFEASRQRTLAAYENAVHRLEKNEELLYKKNKEQDILINNLPAHIYFKDAKLRYKIVNNSFSELNDKSSDQMLEKTDFQIANSIVAETYYQLDNKILQTKKAIYNFEKQHTDKYGKPYWASTSKVPYFDSAGNILGIIGIVTDITERKNAEKAIKENEQKIKRIIDNMIDIYYQTDIDNNLIVLSPSAETQLGYSINDLIGSNLPNSYYYYKDAKIQLENELAKTGKVENFHLVLKHKNGNPIDFETNSRIITNDNEQAIGIEGILRNISRQKKHEKLLIKAKKEAETANRLKSEFLASMSHEIRTPLNAVLGFAEILSTKLSDNTEYGYLLSGIVKGGGNLLILINDILDLSKIEAGYVKMTYKPIHLMRLIDEIQQIFSVKLAQKKLNFEVIASQNLPEYLMLDNTRIRQILFNLFGNAIKFTEKGGITVTLDYVKRSENNKAHNLLIHIIDTGIGIKDDELDKIFEAFRQAEGLEAKYGGTGLGLPITKRLVVAMNGTINVKSQIGKGSDFFIELNNIKIPDAKIMTQSKHKSIDFNRIEFKNPMILIADNNPQNREILKFHLQNHNCSFVEVEKAEDVVATVEQSKPNLIIIDIQMKNIDAYRITCQIRKIDAFKIVPIITISSFSIEETITDCMHIFNAHLTKPLEAKNLVNTISKSLPFSLKPTGTNQQNKATSQALAYTQHQKLHKETQKIFKDTIYPLFIDIMDIMDMEDCRTLATTMQITGIKYNFDIFTHFGNELKKYTDKYDLTNIEKIVSEHKEIFELFYKQCK